MAHDLHGLDLEGHDDRYYGYGCYRKLQLLRLQHSLEADAE